MNKPRERFVYYCIDKITNNVMYVGISNDPKTRIKRHLTEPHTKKGGSLFYYYLRYLKLINQNPVFVIKEKIFQSYTDSELHEAKHIGMHIDTVLNEMYGNGERIQKNRDAKKELKLKGVEVYNPHLKLK